MLLEVTHETTFVYNRPVSEVTMEFRQTPLTDASQHLLQHRQRVTPPRPLAQYVDALGNTVSYFNLIEPQERIQVTFDSIVETRPVIYRGAGIPPEERDQPCSGMLLYDYLQPTPVTEWGDEFLAFIKPFEPLRSAGVHDAASELCRAIRAQFRYEGELTDASSPISELLRHGGGVCQDFAHLMIAGCRYLGFAARYVSGYVVLDNDQAIASHAWAEVFDVDNGWFGTDPTHSEFSEERYVRLGIGRDFRDVPPNRGVFHGKAREEVKVSVSLRPIEYGDLETRARSLYPQSRKGHAGRHPRKSPTVSILEQTASMQQQQQ